MRFYSADFMKYYEIWWDMVRFGEIRWDLWWDYEINDMSHILPNLIKFL